MKRLFIKITNAVKLLVIIAAMFAGIAAGGYAGMVLSMVRDSLWLLFLVPVLAVLGGVWLTKFATWLLRYKPVDPIVRYSGNGARRYDDYRPVAAPSTFKQPGFKPYVPPPPAPYVPVVRNPTTGLAINPHTGYDASGMQYGQFPKRF